jgi:hypothetical protein
MLGGFIVWGELIERDGYSATLLVVALLCLTTAVLYAWTQRSIVFRRSLPGHSAVPLPATCNHAMGGENALRVSCSPGREGASGNEVAGPAQRDEP